MLDAEYINSIIGRDSKKPKLLDLFCGAGGATKGYQRAGFYVVGIDIKRQPHYCGDEFIQTNVFRWLEINLDFAATHFAAVHASPPCQAYSKARGDNERHSDLITPLRPLLEEMELPYVMENIRFSPLQNPVTLCGTMFGLRTYRDRWFETNFPLVQPPHPRHAHKIAEMGRPPAADEFMHIIGNFSDVEAGKWAMGINWMNRDELKEAIPPAYTSYVSTYLLHHLNAIPVEG